MKKKRNELGMAQTDLAIKTGYADKRMIAKIEKGLVDLPHSKINDCAEALCTTASELMGDVEEDLLLANRAKAVMAQNIKYYLHKYKMTSKDLSRSIDEPYSTVRSWTKEKYYPRIDKIEKMATLFKCLKSDLIEDKEKLPAANRELSEVKEELLKMVDRLTEQEAAVYLAALKSALKKE